MKHVQTTYAEVDREGTIHEVKMNCTERPRELRASRTWLPLPHGIAVTPKLKWRWGEGRWEEPVNAKDVRGITLRE